MKNFSKNLIALSTSIRDALVLLDSFTKKDHLTLFVVNESGQIVGSLTDGDIRRGLLAGKTLQDKVEDFMYLDFHYLRSNESNLDQLIALRKKEIDLVPLLDDDKKVVDIIDLAEKKSLLPLEAVIMAGGEGRRLRPLTDTLPKPMLKVGEKPIIEYNIDRLNCYGIDKVAITVKYLGEKIEEHFGDGSSKGMQIRYIRENEPLGTIGSLTLIDKFESDVILVMNSDLLTNIDFEDFYRTFIQKNADMAVASIPYQLNVPYAVLETDQENIVSFREKPTYTYQSNAGIYLIKRKLIDLVPRGQFFNATDLMEKLISVGHKIIFYPALCYWLDIGKPEDYKKAQEDVKHINF